ncbi:hypothetical protein JCM10450v2_005667 [Rhodotorula kratochvilovae]
MRLPLLLALALPALLALAAPIPDPANPKYRAAALPAATTSSTVDPVAAALASKLAALDKALGKRPVLPLPEVLKPTTAAKAAVTAKVVLNAKAAKTRRSPATFAAPPNPKRPSPSPSLSFRPSSSPPIKALPPSPSAPPAQNPKHLYAPPAGAATVEYTFVPPGGTKVVVVEGQGVWTHPGAPKPTTRA